MLDCVYRFDEEATSAAGGRSPGGGRETTCTTPRTRTPHFFISLCACIHIITHTLVSQVEAQLRQLEGRTAGTEAAAVRGKPQPGKYAKAAQEATPAATYNAAADAAIKGTSSPDASAEKKSKKKKRKAEEEAAANGAAEGTEKKKKKKKADAEPASEDKPKKKKKKAAAE